MSHNPIQVMIPDKAILRQYASALLLFVLVTVLFTFPAVFNLGTHFVGSPRGDKFQFIWNFWWVRHAIVDLMQLPFFCPLQYYPSGVSLALHDTTYFWSFLSVPLQVVMDPRLILNLFLVSCFPLNAMAGYHLARQVTGSHRGAIAGGLLFAFCPYLIGRYRVCHIQYLGVFTMPLFFSALYRYRQSARLRHMAFAGGYFSMTALISYYYAAALSLIMMGVVAWRAITLRRDSAGLKRLGVHVTAFALIVVAVLSPFVAPGVVQLARGDYRFSAEPRNNVADNSADLVSFLIPDTTLASWVGWEWSAPAARWARGINGALKGNILEKSVYPGWIGLLALTAAAAWRPLRRAYWPWALLAGVFLTLSLGPSLTVCGIDYLEGLLPYRLLSELPLFGIMRSPSRLAVFITLGAGVTIAGACTQLKLRCRPRIYRLATLGLTAAILLEFLPVQAYFTPNSVYRSPYYQQMANDPSAYTVLNIPVDFMAATGGGDIHVYAQTIHEKPIIGGYVSREPGYALDTLDAHPFLKVVSRGPSGALGVITSPQEMQRTLTELNVGRIILHRALLTPTELGAVSRRLASVLGPPVFEDPWIVVFDSVAFR